MKNILIIQGGGRPNGNTAQLVEHFARGAKEAGHTVEVISLRKQEVKLHGMQRLSVWKALRTEGQLQRACSQN